MILLDRLEIHIALSYPANIDVRILAQGYCFAIVSLSLLLTFQQDYIYKASLSSKKLNNLNDFAPSC